MYPLSKAEARAMLEEEPVENLPGVGHRLHEQLGQLGIALCPQLRAIDPRRLAKAVGAKSAEVLRTLALGEDTRPWEVRPE